MTSVPPNSTPSEFSDSDQQWFDRLTGRVASVSDFEAVHEADVLRGVFTAEDAAVDPQIADDLSPLSHQQSWQQAQFRLRREQADWKRKKSWLRAGWNAALAASVLVGVVVLRAPAERVYDEPPVFRGDIETIHIATAEPRRDAEDWVAALHRTGAKATLNQHGKIFSSDVTVTRATSEDALALLRSRGISTEPGTRRVAFEPK